MPICKSWPENCLWPEPYWDGEGGYWDLDLAEVQDLDEEGQELQDIKTYMDELVEEGRLNDDYSLNEDFEDWDNGTEEEEWEPEKGFEYWDNGFDLDAWLDDLTQHINLLKIEACDPETDPIGFIRRVTGYDFINENLLRQAFTRRSFAVEHNLAGCSEELEFYGDMALNTVVTREMYKRFAETDIDQTDAPFRSSYREGDLSRMRSRFVCKEHLAAKAVELGLDQYILYGSDEKASESACEDMIEALIGAVAVDSDWNWNVIEDVVDRLVCIQLDDPSELTKVSYYEQFNAWHQKHFGKMPSYEVYRSGGNKGEKYYCTLRYFVPENEKGIRTSQRVDVDDITRSKAREYAAMKAISFVRSHGLWIRLEDAHIVPDPEKSINQLQELKQKKYVGEAVYTFEELSKNEWYCECFCDGIEGSGRAVGKVRAKKKAAFMVLVRLMKSAGICKKEWEQAMWETMELQ